MTKLKRQTNWRNNAILKGRETRNLAEDFIDPNVRKGQLGQTLLCGRPRREPSVACVLEDAARTRRYVQMAE